MSTIGQQPTGSINRYKPTGEHKQCSCNKNIYRIELQAREDNAGGKEHSRIQQ
jgi:hypothetical protein